MKIAVIDDYRAVFRELSKFHRFSAREVVTFSELERDMGEPSGLGDGMMPRE